MASTASSAPTAANGWLRLAWQLGFSYLQYTLELDFVSPQHTNQFPIVEVYQALKAYNRDPANASKPADHDGCHALEGVRLADDQRRQHHDRVREPAREAALGGLSYKATDAATPGNARASKPRARSSPGRENGLNAISATCWTAARSSRASSVPQNKNPLIPLLAKASRTRPTATSTIRPATTCRWRSTCRTGLQGLPANGLHAVQPGAEPDDHLSGRTRRIHHGGHGHVPSARVPAHGAAQHAGRSAGDPGNGRERQAGHAVADQGQPDRGPGGRLQDVPVGLSGKPEGAAHGSPLFSR